MFEIVKIAGEHLLMHAATHMFSHLGEYLHTKKIHQQPAYIPTALPYNREYKPMTEASFIVDMNGVARDCRY